MSEENNNTTKRNRAKKSGSTKKKKYIKKQGIVIIFSILLAFIVLTTSGYLYVRSKVYRKTKPTITSTSDVNAPTKPKEETIDYKEVEGITNILLIGADGTDFDSEDQRSDSMIIATLDNNNKKVKLTSLYRDSLVYIPGHGEDKMNSSFALGGPELVMETIKYNYDINIEKYVMINFVGFEAVIDKIGGIDIDVKDYQMHELNKYIGEATGGNNCPVEEPGLQKLNGKQALSYARIRKGVGDDYERTERQREVLFKVADKLQKTSPFKYLGIATSMLDYFRTNIELTECLNMAYTVSKFPSLVTEQLSIPDRDLCVDENVPGIGWVLRMDRYQNALILNDFIFNDTLPDFITNRSTEKDTSIYYEYDGYGATYDDDYYDDTYYYNDNSYNNTQQDSNINTDTNNNHQEVTTPPATEHDKVPEDNSNSDHAPTTEGSTNTGDNTHTENGTPQN